jgi:uncharacterized protein involved in exopolysaccharide biosynthesis
MKDSKPISVTPYVDIIFRHRLSALSVFAVGISATVSLMVLLHDVYRSAAIIVIEPPQVAADYVDVGAANTRDNLSVADQLEALAHKAFSQQRLEELIQKFGLYGYQPGQPLEPRLALMQRLVDLVVPQDTISYETGRAGQRVPDVLKISFEYGDRVIAQRVTQELSDSYIEEGYRERIQRADDATRFLAGQVSQARNRLDAKDSQIKDLERSYEGSLPQELGANLAELERLQDRLASINQQVTAERGMPMVPGQNVATSPLQEITILELKLNQLRSVYKGTYPGVIRLEQQIANLRQMIKAEPLSGAGENSARGDDVVPGQSRLERQAGIAATQIEALKTRIAMTPVHGQELAALQRDYDAFATEYHGLLNKELAANLHESLEKHHQDERLRLLEPASLPRQPDRPNRVAIGILGFCFSAITALALPFGLYFTDTSFKEPEEMQDEFAIPVVAAIPVIEVAGESRMAILRAVAASSAAILVTVGTIWAYVHHLF